MDSRDILTIASDEQAFRVFVIEKLENHEHRLTSIESRQSDFQQIVLKRLDNIEYEQRLLHSKVDGLQTSVYWVLGAVGIFLAALSISAIVASVLSVFKTSESMQADTKQADTLSITNSLLDAFTKGLAAGRSEKN